MLNINPSFGRMWDVSKYNGRYICAIDRTSGQKGEGKV